MPVGADHEVRTGTPVAVLVKMPPHLNPLHGCAAVVAGRGGQGDQIRFVHGPSLPVCPKSIRVVLVDPVSGGPLKYPHELSSAQWTVCQTPLDRNGGEVLVSRAMAEMLEPTHA
jgi:hypothetical protein